MALTRTSTSTDSARTSETSTNQHGRRPQNRRGRPPVTNTADVVRLRDSGLSWRAIARQLKTSPSTVRDAYTRALTTAKCTEIRSTPCEKSAAAIPENGGSDNSGSERRIEEAAPVAPVRETPGARFLRELEAAARARRARLQQTQPKPVRPAPVRIPRQMPEAMGQ